MPAILSPHVDQSPLHPYFSSLHHLTFCGLTLSMLILLGRKVRDLGGERRAR